jgi:phospholipase B1
MVYKIILGGDGTWQSILTVPNILKNFNPYLKGMSHGVTKAYSNKTSGYNLALTGTKTFDLSKQARKLVTKMKRDPRIDFYNDWKMVTILIGHNDVCSTVCKQDLQDLDQVEEIWNVAEALDILYSELPRAFINLMPSAGRLLKDFEFRVAFTDAIVKIQPSLP